MRLPLYSSRRTLPVTCSCVEVTKALRALRSGLNHWPSYTGQWFSPLRKALSAFVTSTQEYVTGKVRLELYKGNLINAGVWSPYSLYREDIATFAAGGDYKQSDATGFISIYGLPTKVQAIVSSEKEGE